MITQPCLLSTISFPNARPADVSSRPSPVWNTHWRILFQGLPRLRMPSLLLGPIAAAVVLDWYHLVDACSSERVCHPSLKLAGQQGPCLPEEALSPANLACMIPAYRYSRCRVDRGQKAARGNKPDLRWPCQVNCRRRTAAQPHDLGGGRQQTPPLSPDGCCPSKLSRAYKVGYYCGLDCL